MNEKNINIYDKELREEFVKKGQVLYVRGLASGSAGNMSAMQSDGKIIVTPTGCCLGDLRYDELSTVDLNGKLIDGPKPTKEAKFHAAIMKNNPDIKAIVHLHSTFATALSCLNNLDPEDVIKPFTPYVVMKMGRIKLIPYFKPGSENLVTALAHNASGNKAWLLANHGLVTGGKNLTEAVNNAEELEATAKLFFFLRSCKDHIRYLTKDEVTELL